MKFDALLQNYLGEFGPFQIIVVLVVCLEDFLVSWQIMSPVFIASTPRHRCDDALLNNWPGNCSTEYIQNITQPWKSDPHKNEQHVDNCRIFELNMTSEPADWKEEVCAGLSEPPQIINTRNCEEFSYDGDLLRPSIVVDFDLVCERDWVANTIASVYMSGRVVGIFFFGLVSDRFGRRRIILIVGLGSVLASFLSASSPNIAMFLVFRFLHALMATGKNTAGFVLALEYVGPSKRAVVGFQTMLCWTMGYMALSGVAYLFRQVTWRVFLAAITLPELIYLGLFFFLVPESPRWLYMRNRPNEADGIMEKMAARNGSKLPYPLHLEPHPQAKTRTPANLFKSKGLRRVSLVLCLNWATNAFVYYGLSLNTSNLGGNPYLNFLISGAVEIPANILGMISFIYWGRVRPYAIAMLVGGALLMLTLPIPVENHWSVLSLQLLGKLSISASFSMGWVYAVEVYPTCIRGLGLMVPAMAAKLMASLASYINLLENYSHAYPLLILGSLSVASGMLTLLLPEVKGNHMPQTIPEAEELVQNNKSKCVCWGHRKSVNIHHKESHKDVDPIYTLDQGSFSRKQNKELDIC